MKSIAGTWLFRAPSQFVSQREYTRNGFRTFSFNIGFIVTLVVMGLVTAIVGSSGPSSYAVVFLDIGAALYFAKAQLRRRKSNGDLYSCGDGTNCEADKGFEHWWEGPTKIRANGSMRLGSFKVEENPGAGLGITGTEADLHSN